MSFAIDLREHGSDLKREYECVISSDPDTVWTIFDYEGSGNAVKPANRGSGGLDEFVDAFDDARIEYGFVRVEFNNVNKVVLVGWIGENVCARQRLTFNAHMSAIAKQFPGHHVQITARSNDELSPKIILDKLNTAAGSKYAGSAKQAPPTKPKYIQAKEGADEKDWSETTPIEEKELEVINNSGYKSNVRAELEQFRKGKPFRAEEESSNGIAGLNSGTSYRPVGKIDLKKIREEAKGSKFADSRIEKIEPAYKPVGKVDLKAIREQARKEKELKARRGSNSADSEPKSVLKMVQKQETASKSAQKPSSSGEDDDEPRFASLSDRMKAFQSSVNGAKPKFDVELNSRPKTLRKFESKATKMDPEDAKEDSDEEASLSVAAQLAKARISKSGSREPEREPTKTDEPKKNVSSFAARFAQKQPEKPEEHEEVEELEEVEENPPAPKRPQPQPAEVEPEGDDGLKAVAIQDYPKGDEDEIELKEGDLVVRIQKVDENWWIGENKLGAVGLFPKDYVEVEGETKSEIKSESSSGSKTAIAQYSYEAGDDDELSFEENEIITGVEFPSEDWWSGKNAKGAFGLFPASYVTLQ